MIHDVDTCLDALVRREVLNGSGVELSLEAPTRDWSSRRTTPTVDLYLYDVREDVDRRQTQRVDVRDDDGRVLRRELPPRRFRLSYLVSAWAQRPEDEHRLLSACLGTFLRHDALPVEVLSPSLADTGLPVIVEVALPRSGSSITDVWNALGSEPRPALDLVVIAPFVLDPEAVAPLVLAEPQLDVARDGDLVERRQRRGAAVASS